MFSERCGERNVIVSRVWLLTAVGLSSGRNDIELCCHSLRPGSAHFFSKPAAASQAAVLFASGPSALHSRPDLCENQHLSAVRVRTGDPGRAEKLAKPDFDDDEVEHQPGEDSARLKP